MVNDWCRGLIDADTSEELTSTEDFLSVKESTNKLIKEGKIDPDDFVIGSLDVENLYGSINTQKAAEIVRERVK